MTSRTHTHKTINLQCWPSTPRPDAMSTKTMNLRRCWFGSPFSIGVDDISPLKTMNLWRCWPPSTPQKTINLRHWWFPSAFPAALLTLPPPTPHPPKKIINLRHCWPTCNATSRKIINLRHWAVALEKFPPSMPRPFQKKPLALLASNMPRPKRQATCVAVGLAPRFQHWPRFVL